MVWSVLVAALLLGPALAPGYVLTYDMVWVPDLALRPDFLGLGSSLPRAVPSDALVAGLDELVPGMVLQKLVLVGSLVAGGLGAARLVPVRSLAASLVAVTLYQWNPFVVERLQLGSWPVLVGYGALPWVVRAASDWRRTERMPARLPWLVVLGSLSAATGIATGVAVVAFAARGRVSRWLSLGGLFVAGNAPWLVAGLLHAGSARSAAVGAEVFALRGSGDLAAPLTALGLGGIWNHDVVLPSTSGVRGVLLVVLVLALVAVGLPRWWRSRSASARDAGALAACWLIGWTAAVLTWAAPGAVGWLVAHVPGAGVLRDGSRLLMLCAPGLVVVAATGAAGVCEKLPRLWRPSAVLAVTAVPLVLLPDAAWGSAGRLQAVSFPSDYAAARRVVAHAAEAGDDGDVLLLPLSSYRQPAWNRDRKVVDPTGRYLTSDFLTSDELVVGTRVVPGEDPRVRRVQRILSARSPEQRSSELARAGFGFVVTARDAEPAPSVAGPVIHDGALLRVQELAGARPPHVSATWVAALSAAWALFLGLPLAAIGTAGWRRWRRRRAGPSERAAPPRVRC